MINAINKSHFDSKLSMALQWNIDNNKVFVSNAHTSGDRFSSYKKTLTKMSNTLDNVT